MVRGGYGLAIAIDHNETSANTAERFWASAIAVFDPARLRWRARIPNRTQTKLVVHGYHCHSNCNDFDMAQTL